MEVEKIEEEIKFFISFLYLKHPFYNALISSIDIELESTEDSEKYGIYSKNNDSIHIDYGFAGKELVNDKKVFFYYIIHELLHILLKHKIRGIGKHLKKWEKATDISIDAVIHKDSVIQKLVKTPDQKKGINKIYDFGDTVSSTAEDFYKTVKISEEKEGESCKKESESDSEGSCEPESKSEDCVSKSPSNASCNSKKMKNTKGHLQNHKSWDLSDKNIDKEESSIDEKIVKAYQFTQMQINGNKSSGGIPGEFMEMVNQLLEPKTGLLEYITKWVQNMKHYSNSYKRGDRRYLYKNLIVPSKIKNIKHFDLLFYIDTSGSLNLEELGQVFSEMYYIINSLKSYSIDIIQSDAGITDIHTIDNKSPLDMEKFLTVKGRGGTEMKPLFNYLKKTDKKYDLTMVFSDYYISEKEIKGLKKHSEEYNMAFISAKGNNQKYSKQLDPLFLLN